MTNSWFICDSEGGMKRHVICPGGTSYRLSLTNGKWSVYKNEDDVYRISVVSTRHSPTEESERWYPEHRITIKDYTPINVNDVPDEVIEGTFYTILNRQIRGGR